MQHIGECMSSGGVANEAGEADPLHREREGKMWGLSSRWTARDRPPLCVRQKSR